MAVALFLLKSWNPTPVRSAFSTAGNHHSPPPVGTVERSAVRVGEQEGVSVSARQSTLDLGLGFASLSVLLAPVVGGGVVGVGQTVGVYVDECCDREGEVMVESVFDVVGGVVACFDR